MVEHGNGSDPVPAIFLISFKRDSDQTEAADLASATGLSSGALTGKL
jgi:hypothetical protein